MVLDNLDCIKAVTKGAHRVYLDNWETKTLIAEHDGVWNQEIQHRVITSVEHLSSELSMLCRALERIVALNEFKTIDD